MEQTVISSALEICFIVQVSKKVPDLKIEYEVDSRQQIADSWPMVGSFLLLSNNKIVVFSNFSLQSVQFEFFIKCTCKVFDDSLARKDWGWQHNIGLEQLVDIMITNLRWSRS